MIGKLIFSLWGRRYEDSILLIMTHLRNMQNSVKNNMLLSTPLSFIKPPASRHRCFLKKVKRHYKHSPSPNWLVLLLAAMQSAYAAFIHAFSFGIYSRVGAIVYLFIMVGTHHGPCLCQGSSLSLSSTQPLCVTLFLDVHPLIHKSEPPKLLRYK